jgi:hypothetical protein
MLAHIDNFSTSVIRTEEKDGKVFTVLNVIRTYCSLVLQTKFFRVIFIRCLYKISYVLKMFTATEATFLPNAPIQNRPPDSRLNTPGKKEYM